jgi:enoyl-CoA hydratase
VSIVTLERADEGVGLVRVSRPERRNALNWQAQGEFAAALKDALLDQEVRAVVIAGSGPAFLSGGDLAELNDYPEREDGLRLSQIMGDALAALWASGIPSLAAIHGPARGGGAEVAMWCDFRWMAVRADIAFVHSTLGLVPGWGGKRRLEEVVGRSLAAELLASGRVVKAEEAARIGLVDEVLDEAQLMSCAVEYAAKIASNYEKGIARGQVGPEVRRALLKERAEFLRRWDSDLRRDRFRTFAEK